MTKTVGYAAFDKNSDLKLFEFTRREPRADDIVIKILYCGVCHSDLHQVRNEWHDSIYPMVPGHEIIGEITQIGEKVNTKKFKIGDLVGVGCMVDSCRNCPNCLDNLQQFCDYRASYTYNSYDRDPLNQKYRDEKLVTYGGYSKLIIVNQDFVLKINDNYKNNNLTLAAVTPLLCAGITTYSPLNYFKVNKQSKIAIIGMGGLGHMAVKIAKALGAEITVFTRSIHKQQDALSYGASQVIINNINKNINNYKNYFDLILNTVSEKINLDDYLSLLKRDGVMVLVGLPTDHLSLNAGSLISPRRLLTGSLIGGIKETQEMLDFCYNHNILSAIELISINQINLAYKRLTAGNVRYRFVIDLNTL